MCHLRWRKFKTLSKNIFFDLYFLSFLNFLIQSVKEINENKTYSNLYYITILLIIIIIIIMLIIILLKKICFLIHLRHFDHFLRFKKHNVILIKLNLCYIFRQKSTYISSICFESRQIYIIFFNLKFLMIKK